MSDDYVDSRMTPRYATFGDTRVWMSEHVTCHYIQAPDQFLYIRFQTNFIADQFFYVLALIRSGHLQPAGSNENKRSL